MALTNIELSCGFVADIDEATFDDMELIDALAELGDGNPLAMPKIATLMFGKEGKKQLYDALRTEEGRVPTAAFNEAITEAMDCLKSKKK